MRALPRRVLAVGAHPDDIELLCAGTLARFVAEGSEVRLAVVCRGDRGGSIGSDPILAATRHDEATGAAEILGVPVDFLGFGDSEVRDTPETRQVFLELIRSTRCDILITHSPTDYHHDHLMVCTLVTWCSWFAASGGHQIGSPPLDRPPALVYMDNVAAIDFVPTHYVDIGATIEIKRRMLACHASQLRRDDGGLHALAELSETQARLRGFQCGVRYAEAFRATPLWGRRRSEPLLP